MPDVATLRSAIEIDESLRSVFWNNESAILQSILGIDPTLMPEVLAVLASTRFHFGKVRPRASNDPWSRSEVHRILHQYFQRQPFAFKWSYVDALVIDQIYGHIRFFVDDFASSVLSTHVVTGEKQSTPAPLSPNEKCRLERAFLRFELFCNLFRERGYGRDRFSPDELHDSFFKKFAPWENEELACINDYMCAKITIPFNDVADHDIRWGEDRIYAYEECCPEAESYTQGTISQGLAYIRRLVTAPTFQERCELLGEFPERDYDFFLEGLRVDYKEDDVRRPLSHYDENQKKALASKSSIEDPDPGPFNAWYWAHARDYRQGFFCEREHMLLRERGYVMWDQWRLLEWNLFGKPFEEEDYPYPVDHLTEERQEEVEESWDIRREIFRNGGRGWWSKDDESKIVWLKPGT
ncbi:hypothetical protein FQN54_004372 [Arachnomyces sp. PD_36]|nr:hypothetical protein FQN54_004372 [Arachnomyces sp. PD_36]